MQDENLNIDIPENGCSCDEGCCHHKQTPRADEAVHLLQNRLNRLIGQLNGIKKMLDTNRYCGDILTQVAAAQSALRAFGYIVLQDHMETCVSDEIQKGNHEIIEETVELIKKLKQRGVRHEIRKISNNRHDLRGLSGKHHPDRQKA